MTIAHLPQVQRNLPLCACGCGQPVTQHQNKYIHGHKRPTNQGVRSQLQSVVNGDDVILTQNLEVVQCMLNKFLKGNKEGQNVINIVTIGPIKIESAAPAQAAPQPAAFVESEVEVAPVGQPLLSIDGQSAGHADDLPCARTTHLERQRPAILHALQDCDWSQKRAAQKLGISARRMNYAVGRLGISHPNWRKNNQTE